MQCFQAFVMLSIHQDTYKEPEDQAKKFAASSLVFISNETHSELFRFQVVVHSRLWTRKRQQAAGVQEKTVDIARSGTSVEMAVRHSTIALIFNPCSTYLSSGLCAGAPSHRRVLVIDSA